MPRPPERPSIETRVAQFQAYYACKNTRPLFGFFVGSEYPLFRYEAARSLPSDRPLVPDDLDPVAYAADSDRLFDANEKNGDDFIWSASAFWGIPWVEAALGCEIWADHKSGSAFSKTPTGFEGPDSIPEFDQDAPWNRKIVSMLDALAEKSAGRWPIGTTRMRGIADLLAALYGNENFLFAMIEKPDEVEAACNRLTDFWIAMGKLQLERIPLFHGGVGSFCYNIWAPPGTVWHQEDVVAMLSPDLYESFIRPCDQRIIEAFDHCIMHQHPAGYLPVDKYLELGFTVLELHVDVGGPRPADLKDKYQSILASQPLLIWGKLSNEELDWIFDNLPPQGLAVMNIVDESDEARQLWKRYVGSKI